MKKLATPIWGLFLWTLGSISQAVTCPDPGAVSLSLGNFDLSKKETASFIDHSPGQIDDERPLDQPQALKFKVRPDCYSSDNVNLQGCPKNAFTQLQFRYAMLNRFRSGDKGTVWCYYQTPDGSMISTHIDAPSEGTYRIADPSGTGWNTRGRMLFRCDATQVEQCPFDFEGGKLPDALSAP